MFTLRGCSKRGMASSVYLAGSIQAAEEVCDLAGVVEACGGRVVSTWHTRVLASGETADPMDGRERVAIFDANLSELRMADLMIALPYLGEPRATFCEIGWVLAKGVPVAWVHDGRYGRNIFDEHRQVKRFALSVGWPGGWKEPLVREILGWAAGE